MSTPLPTTARRWTLAALVSNVGIVVTGGIVRLSGSGLGCSDWPACEGSSVVPAVADASWHTYVEFGNRLLTFVVLAACLGAWWTVRRMDSSARARRLALALPVGVLAQAVLGGVTVLTGLHPLTVAAHFLLSAVLIALATALLDSLDRPHAVLAPPTRRAIVARVTAGVGFGVLVLGTIVTATGPHAGDPGTERLAFSIRHVTRLHSLSVYAVVLFSVLVLVLARRAGDVALGRAATVLVGLELVQGGVGHWQYAVGVPQTLVSIHLLLACLFWVACVRVLLVATRREGFPPAPSLDTERSLLAR